jgi:hypothetical protein
MTDIQQFAPEQPVRVPTLDRHGLIFAGPNAGGVYEVRFADGETQHLFHTALQPIPAIQKVADDREWRAERQALIDTVREALEELVANDGDERDWANQVLESIGEPPLSVGHKVTASVTIEATVEILYPADDPDNDGVDWNAYSAVDLENAIELAPLSSMDSDNVNIMNSYFTVRSVDVEEGDTL